jgi:hypothetical protein
MKMMTLRIERTEKTIKPMAAWLMLCVCAGLLAGCASGKPVKRTDRQLFDAIKLGMDRAEVRRLAGPALLSAGNEVYYGGAPMVESWQQPPMPATIKIVYSTNDVVVGKVFNDGNQAVTEGEAK